MISSSPTSILSQSLVGEDEGSEEPWTILPASEKSLRTTNPIRAIVDPIVANLGQQTHDKSFLSLAVRSIVCFFDELLIILSSHLIMLFIFVLLQLGDPTASGNLPPCPVALQAVQRALQTTGHAAGYVSACGTPQARKAIARFHHSTSSNNDDHDSSTPVVSPDNVIVASGCSGALELALTALLDEDSVLLVPQPGFPLYQVIAESHGARVVHYRLLPHQNWECDLAHLQSLMRQYGNKNVVRGLVLNNPSNPTGAVFSAAHLRDVLGFCQQHKLPIVADEVYGDLTFAGHEFHPVAQVAADLGRQVPVIAASGLGKQYLVPGWRVGWVVFHDKYVTFGCFVFCCFGFPSCAYRLLHLLVSPPVCTVPCDKSRQGPNDWPKSFWGRRI